MAKSEIHTFGPSINSINCHAWNKDRSQVAFSPNSNEIHIYQREEGEWKLLETLKEHEMRVMGIDWAPNTNRIVSCSADRNAYVWTQNSAGSWQPALVFLRISRAANCVKWAPAENKFAVGSGAHIISVCHFDAQHNWWMSKHIKKHLMSTITTLDWHPNSCLLAAGSTDCKVRIFSAILKDIEQPPALASPWGSFKRIGQLLRELCNSNSSAGGWVYCVSFSSDGTKLCWVGHDSCISIAEAHSGAPIVRTCTSFLPFVRCEWISPVSIVVAGYSCMPLIYSLSGERRLQLSVNLDQLEKRKPSLMTARTLFQSLDRYMSGSSNDTLLDSVHQNVINCLQICGGDKSCALKISSSGQDGQLVIWLLDTLSNPPFMAQEAAVGACN